MNKNDLPRLIVIIGYTAIGKSDLAITIGQRLNGEIISADSRQVYKYLDLGTAKVTFEEQLLVPHHLIDVVEPGIPFSLAQYQELAFDTIDKIVERGKLPILVGGTGLYIWSIVDNLKIPQCPPDYELREQLNRLDLVQLGERLEKLDPKSAKDENLIRNKRRLIRAIEVSMKLNVPFAKARGKGNPKYQILQVGLKMPSTDLYDRIDRRVDLRFELGMVEEVEELLKMGVSHDWLERLGLEYRHISWFLRGKTPNYDEMVQKLKFDIHKFARRQKTWFKKDKRIVWIEAKPYYEEIVISEIQNFLRNSS